MSTITESVNTPEAVVPSSKMSPELAQQWLDGAVAVYDPNNRIISSVIEYSSSANTLTQTRISEIGTGTQSDLSKVLEANTYIRQFINTNDIIGLVYSAINSSINTDFRLSYRNFGTQKKKLNQLKKAKELIDDFNVQINVRELIRDAILATYTEGNYVCVMRTNGDNWVVTRYPLGIAEISPYLESSRPIVQINMDNLKNALQRTILKNKKGKALYYEDVLGEIQGAFGPEIVQAYKNKDQYCRLPIDYTGVCRINTQGGIYGLSPVFRCLSSAIILDTLRTADLALAQTKRKVIIHQVMRKELANQNQTSNFELLAWNHKNLISAFKQNTVLVTTDPSVETIQYVCPKVDEVSTTKQNAYARQVLSSLGVSFLVPDESISATTAKVSWTVLLQQINAIGEQVERMLEGFYRTLLATNGIDAIYAPTVRILDAEMLDPEQRLEFAKLLYGTLNCSMQTTLGTLGFDLEDERARREQENEDGLDQIFLPRLTAYTAGGDSENTGRPPESNPDDEGRQDYDENYNENNR